MAMKNVATSFSFDDQLWDEIYLWDGLFITTL